MEYLIISCSLTQVKMSEADVIAELSEGIEKLQTEEEKSESEVESDTVSEEEVTETTESEQKEKEEVSEEVTEESKDESETESEVEFDFHNSTTRINELVSNLKNLPEEERNTQISKLTREKEIEAVKQAFPDAVKEEVPVSRTEYEALMKKIEEQGSTENTEKFQKALEIASKLQATEGLTDGRMKDLMLQEQFGESYKDVAKDPKFITAYEKYPSLTIEEKLELACSLSPVAKKLATNKEVQNQVRLKNTKTVTSGKQDSTTKGMTAGDVKGLDDFEKLIAEQIG